MKSSSQSGLLSHWLLRETLILAGLTGFAYALAWSFEMTYAIFFDIPLSLIHPTSGSLVLPTAHVAWVSIALFFKLSQLHEPRHDFRVKDSIFALILLFLPILGALLVYGRFDVSSVFTAGLSFALSVSVAMHHERLVTAQMTDTDKKSLERRLNSLQRHRWAFLFFYVFISGFAFSLLGEGIARRQTNFLTLDANPPMVVLRTYGNRMVASEFVREDSTLTGRLTILNTDDIDGEIMMRYEEVGPFNDDE